MRKLYAIGLISILLLGGCAGEGPAPVELPAEPEAVEPTLLAEDPDEEEYVDEGDDVWVPPICSVGDAEEACAPAEGEPGETDGRGFEFITFEVIDREGEAVPYLCAVLTEGAGETQLASLDGSSDCTDAGGMIYHTFTHDPANEGARATLRLYDADNPDLQQEVVIDPVPSHTTIVSVIWEQATRPNPPEERNQETE